MNELKEFLDIVCGSFNNKGQFEEMEKEGKLFPFAEHINTRCNGKIKNLPENFKGEFIVEESYYTVNGKKSQSSHIFLFTKEEDGVLLTSYEIPEGYDKKDFKYESILEEIDFEDLKKSEKFNPALFIEKNGVWEGGSESMFSPVLKFKLKERFSKGCLEVSEVMEVNGKRTFGYDEPILYKRV